MFQISRQFSMCGKHSVIRQTVEKQIWTPVITLFNCQMGVFWDLLQDKTVHFLVGWCSALKMEKYCNNKCVYESLQDNFHQRLKNQRMLTFLSSLRSRSAKIRVLDDRIWSRSDHDLDHFWRKNDSSWPKFESGKILDFILINSKPQILLFLLIFFAKRHAKRGGLL